MGPHIKKYRLLDKKAMFDRYETRSKAITDAFKEGKMTQEEFDREHEALDGMFKYLK